MIEMIRTTEELLMNYDEMMREAEEVAELKSREKLREALEPLKGAVRTTHPDNFQSGWNEAVKYIKEALQKEQKHDS